MKKISKINQLVLRGLLAENQDLFLNRLSILVDRYSDKLLSQLAEGVVVSVKVRDEAAAIADMEGRNQGNGWTILEITQLQIQSSGDVRVGYKYSGKTRWFKTQEKADRFAQGYSESGVENMDEEHQFKGVYKSTSWDTISIQDWMEVEYL